MVRESREKKYLRMEKLVDEMKVINDTLISEENCRKSEDPKGSYLIFPEGNKIFFYQDHGFGRGVPSGVRFKATFRGDAIDLNAPGYGEKGGDYGSGEITIYLQNLPSEHTDDLKKLIQEKIDKLQEVLGKL